MARAGSRREFVLRIALGASGGRLLRQSVTEGAVMSVAGGILGLWLASAGVRALIRAYPTASHGEELTLICRSAGCARPLAGTALLFDSWRSGAGERVAWRCAQGGRKGFSGAGVITPAVDSYSPSRFRG